MSTLQIIQLSHLVGTIFRILVSFYNNRRFQKIGLLGSTSKAGKDLLKSVERLA